MPPGFQHTVDRLRASHTQQTSGNFKYDLFVADYLTSDVAKLGELREGLRLFDKAVLGRRITDLAGNLVPGSNNDILTQLLGNGDVGFMFQKVAPMCQPNNLEIWERTEKRGDLVGTMVVKLAVNAYLPASIGNKALTTVSSDYSVLIKLYPRLSFCFFVAILYIQNYFTEW